MAAPRSSSGATSVHLIPSLNQPWLITSKATEFHMLKMEAATCKDLMLTSIKILARGVEVRALETKTLLKKASTLMRG